jgi:hypothetical protein
VRAILVVLVSVVVLVLTARSAAEALTVNAVVLGSTTSFEPYGHGWGTPHPAAVDNGGDGSGRAWGLRWNQWGSRTSLASGFTYLEPTVTRFWRKGRLEFRATRIGHCVPGGPLAYTRLQARVAELHSGSFGPWSLWNLRPNLCNAS